MSYCKLITFADGLPSGGIEFRNAWGGSARIWDALFEAHIPKQSQFDSWLLKPSDSRLWDLARRKDLKPFERAVHAFTFDRFFVKRANFTRLAADLRLFVERYPVAGKVDHLPAWASWLENEKAEAVAIYGTSVGDNPWFRAKSCPHCGQSIDENEPIPLSEGTEVYEWLQSVDNPA